MIVFNHLAPTPQTWHILQNTPYTENDDDDDQVGIGRLLSAGVFCAAYPLHEVCLCHVIVML